MLSVVIPALNAGDRLGETLASIGGMAGCEVIVADGGSADQTLRIARDHGAIALQGPRGRGAQLAAGAAMAGGQWFLFLHADTRLPDGWDDTVRRFMDGERAEERAAAFRLRFDDDCASARRLERIVAWRTSTLGLPYGDQGLLISRHLYDKVGGYRPLALMEDVDLACRIGRRRIALLPQAVITSAERYRREGYLRRSARNLLCLSLWRAGVPIHHIQRLYG